ncbi:MAG: sortase [Anaerolineae bacterium]|nr:sortase [Anaerolineae bacterium]
MFTRPTFGQQPEGVFLVRQSIIGSDKSIDAAVFSPDGQQVTTAGRDNTVYLWDWSSGERVWQSRAHDDWVTSLVFSPDGRWLYSGSRDRTVRRINARTGELDSILGQHEARITSVAASQDGQWVASSDQNGIVYIYDAESSQRTGIIHSEGGQIWQVLFSPESRYLAIASEDGTVSLYDPDDLSRSGQFTAYEEPVTQIVFAAAGEQIVTGSLSGDISVWDIGDLNHPEVIATSKAHIAPVMALSWLDGNHLVSSSLDGKLIMWRWDRTQLQPIYIYENGYPLLHHAIANDRIVLVDTVGKLVLMDAPPALINQLSPESIIIEQSQSAAPSENASTVATPSLTIPSIGIASGLTIFPLDGEGRTWGIDPWEHEVGHFYGTSWLGTPGNVVLGAHSEYPDGKQGTFYALENIGLGDEVIIRDGDLTERYIVTYMHSVDYRDVSVVYPTRDYRVTLITCDIPSYVAEQGLYYERLVVVAQKLN